MKRKQSNKADYTSLENRQLLAVTVGTMEGHLWVEGNADGVVEVVAVGEQAFEVKDNGVSIGTYENITKNLRVKIDQAGGAQDDHVVIDMQDEVVENIAVDLGNGDNRIDISGTRQRGSFFDQVDRVVIQGGTGNDTANISLITDKTIYAAMGHGDDSLKMNSSTSLVRFYGQLGNDHFEVTEVGSTEFNGPKIGRIVSNMGAGDDTVDLGAETYANGVVVAGDGNDIVNTEVDAVFSDLYVDLGEGSNQMTHHGWVGGKLFVRGGSGNDAVRLAEGSMAAGGGYMHLGDGSNDVALDGVAWGSLVLRGGEGSDNVSMSETAELRDFRASLGGGANRLHNKSNVTGDLLGFSRNSLDVFTNEGSVDGRVNLNPGGQTW